MKLMNMAQKHSSLEDEYAGLYAMEDVEEEKYLGDIITNDGKNVKNIAARTNRGIGTVNQIMSILDDICFGKYYFKVAMVFRNSLLLSSLLTNAEAWYNLSDNDVTELEKIDESLLRRVLECPISTPKEMLYLELGVTPIRNIIRKRRLNFLQYILHEEKDSLMYSFLKAQLDQPTRNDWGQTVLKDIQTYKLDLTVDDIESMSQAKFNTLVKTKGQQNTLEYLNGKKGTHTKVLHIEHSDLVMQDYLQPNDLSIKESKFTFIARNRMIDIKGNYSGQYSDTLCPLCEVEEDIQPHLLECEELCDDSSIVRTLPEYEYVKNSDG